MYRTLIQRYGHFILGVFLLGGGALGVFLKDLQVEPSMNVFLDQTDDDLAYYNLSRTEWAYDEYAMICVRREDWFTPESIGVLTKLTATLEQVPHVSSTTSILDVPLMRNRAGLMALLQGPITLADKGVNLQKARKEIVEDAHTQALGNLISTDGRDLMIIVNLDVPEEMVRLDREWSRAQGERDAGRIAELEKPYEVALGELHRRRTVMVKAVRRIASFIPSGSGCGMPRRASVSRRGSTSATARGSTGRRPATEKRSPWAGGRTSGATFESPGRTGRTWTPRGSPRCRKAPTRWRWRGASSTNPGRSPSRSRQHGPSPWK